DRLATSAGDADERIELWARGDAAWHAVAYATLSATWTSAEGIAWGRHLPHRLLLGAITLRPVPALPAPASGNRPRQVARRRAATRRGAQGRPGRPVDGAPPRPMRGAHGSGSDDSARR